MTNIKRAPMILMSVSSRTDASMGLEQYSLYKNYVKVFSRAGAAVLLVTDITPGTLDRLCDAADGLVITGGSAVNPAIYGAERQSFCGTVDAPRDEVEVALFKAFAARRKPVLGICHGMGIINAVLGGTMTQDIARVLGEAHPSAVSHPVNVKKGSFIEKLFSERFTVNSHHHQAMGRMAEDFEAVAWTDSGQIVEAAEHKTLPIWAVQWHPERMCGPERYSPDGPDMMPLIEAFVGLCREA